VRRADSLIIPLVKELRIEDGIRLIELKKNWDNLFDEPLSSHMSPHKLSAEEILLNVDSPVWLQELNFYKKNIIDRLSSYGIREIRFRLGRILKRTKYRVKCQEARVTNLSTKELSYIENAVSQINDEELSKTIRRAIEKAFTSGRTKL
jgi:hypothetical protein